VKNEETGERFYKFGGISLGDGIPDLFLTTLLFVGGGREKTKVLGM
jgi:hypothetical protein